MKLDKFMKIIYIASGVAMILLVIGVQIYLWKEHEEIDPQKSAEIVAQNDEPDMINLCVMEKKTEYKGILGSLSEFYLILSNDMLVYVSEEDFSKYEVNHYYDFKLVRRTTVTQWLEAADF